MCAQIDFISFFHRINVTNMFWCHTKTGPFPQFKSNPLTSAVILNIMKSIKSVCFDFRFIQMAPLYFFYNLPPSESKEILQDMLDPVGSPKRTKEKLSATTASTEASAEAQQTADRCAIQ